MVGECLRRAAVTVRCGELSITIPADSARRALKALRRQKTAGRSRRDEKCLSGDEANQEQEGAGETRTTERAGSQPPEREIGGEKEKASRNWTRRVEATTLADALDTLPKFRAVFAKEEADVKTGEIGGEKKIIVMHVTFACSRSTLTAKSIREPARLVSAVRRGRLSSEEAHALVGDGFREFAGM